MIRFRHIIKYKPPIIVLVIILTGLLNLLTLVSSAQNQQNTEKVFVHINRQMLFNGSILKYTAYITNETDLNLSTVVYFTLTNTDKSTCLKWKDEAYHGVATGAFEIPDTIPNGSYLLQAFSNKMRNYPPALIYTIPISIQKLYEKPEKDHVLFKNHKSNIQDTNLFNDTYFTISTTLGNNSTINIKPIQAIDSAILSISVVEESKIENPVFANNFQQYIKAAHFIKAPITNLTIEQGYSLISGRLVNLTNSIPVKNEIVYLSTPDSTIHFKYAKTDEYGYFCMLLDSTLSNKPIFLQIASLNCSSDSIAWKIFDKTLAKSEISDTNTYNYDITELDYIEQLQKRELIDRIYNVKGISKWDNQEQTTNTANFFNSPDYIVRPDEYLDLPNYREICDNLLPMVKYKMHDGQMQFGMVLKELSSVQYDNTICFIDGVPCFNMKYIESLSSKEIDRIEVVNSYIMYGELSFGGLMAIYTKQGKFNKAAFCNSHYAFINNFNTNEASSIIIKAGNPNVLPDVYWNASVMVKNDEITLKMGKIEVGSSYIININGLINGILPYTYQKTIKMK